MLILLFILYQGLATWNCLKLIFLILHTKTCMLDFTFALNFILNMLQVEDNDALKLE
ncbi:hypothetical protein Hanom_Chr02g00130111 [Helianthus anomalus]